jgi:hypothetical protein
MNIKVYKHKGHPVNISQTPLKREWMDNTADAHAYKCFPVSQANTFGWSISFTEDIEFIWDGISDASPNHVTILKAPEGVCSANRGNGTISFYTGIFITTDENTSVVSIAPPNYFIDGASAFTSIISTSFFDEAIPAAWKITRANEKIIIPAGTPVITLIPMSIGGLSNIEIDLYDKEFSHEKAIQTSKRNEAWKKISESGGFTNYYRDAVDYEGNSIGKHELKALRLRVNDYTGKTKDDIII